MFSKEKYQKVKWGWYHPVALEMGVKSFRNHHFILTGIRGWIRDRLLR